MSMDNLLLHSGGSEMTPIRPSVSPLPSFASRPEAPQAAPSAPLAKRAAQWLVTLRKRATARVGKI